MTKTMTRTSYDALLTSSHDHRFSVEGEYLVEHIKLAKAEFDKRDVPLDNRFLAITDRALYNLFQDSDEGNFRISYDGESREMLDMLPMYLGFKLVHLADDIVFGQGGSVILPAWHRDAIYEIQGDIRFIADPRGVLTINTLETTKPAIRVVSNQDEDEVA